MRFALSILMLLTSTAGAAEPQTYCRASVGTVNDGDTLTALIDLGWNVHYGWVTIRAANMDAWETSRARKSGEFDTFNPAEWSEEIRKGVLARDALKELLAKGQLWVRPSKERDPHGRVAAHLYVQTPMELVDVAKFMKEHGHTRR